MVDLYANSRASIAVDTLRLDLADPDANLNRADAEANKVEDIRGGYKNVDFVALCRFSPLPGREKDNRNAVRILTDKGIEVMTDADQAAERVLKGLDED